MSFILVIALLLVCASIFVNGWTDAPNAIATVVSTRVLHPRAAILLGAIMNFFGVFLMGTAVATTTATIVSIGSGSDALVTLAAAQLAIVLWAVGAWRFGIPTSESHALIAGLMGAGMSLSGFSAFNMDSVVKVLWGLFISSVVGFSLALLFTKTIKYLFRHVKRRLANRFFSVGQIASASLMAFSHGAQDGQKFMGIMVLALVVGGMLPVFEGVMVIPVWVMIVASVLMAIGTSIGGYRIIKTMGMDMVSLQKYQGFAAELAASGSMLVATFLGIPLSTTNTKGTAMMGAGAAEGLEKVNWDIAKEMFTAWILTFPACMMLGYIFAIIFRALI